MEELNHTISYNEWQKISIQREVKLLCQKYGYEFSQSKLDELLEIYKDETEGVYEFCCLLQSSDIDYNNSELLKMISHSKTDTTYPCKLGSDMILYLYTQIANEVGWNEVLVYCYNRVLKYTLPF